MNAFGIGLSLFTGLVLFLLAGWLMLLGIVWLIRQLLGKGPAERVEFGGGGFVPASAGGKVVPRASGPWRSLVLFSGLVVLGMFGFVVIGSTVRTTTVTRVTSGDEEMTMISPATGPEGVVIQRISGLPQAETSRPQNKSVREKQRELSASSEQKTSAGGQNTERAGTVSELKVVIPKTPEERRRLLAEFAVQVGRLFGDDDGEAEAGAVPPSLGESRNGEVVILELTQPMIRQLLGDTAGDMLRDMQSRLPADIREGYALIPLGRSLGSAIPPVPPRLAASGLSSLADSLVSILSGNSRDKSASGVSGSEDGSVKAASGGDGAVDLGRPDWISSPGAGSRVVRLTRLGAADQLELERAKLLSEAAREILLERAEAEGVSGDFLEAVRVVSFAGSVVPGEGAWVPGSYTEQVEADLGGASGAIPVTVDYYLVQIPGEVRVMGIPEIVSRVQRVRMAGLFSCGVSLWLGMVLISATGRRVAGVGRRGWLVMLGRIGACVCLLAAVLLGVSLFSGKLSSRTAAAFVSLK